MPTYQYRPDTFIGGNYQPNDFYITKLLVNWRPRVEIVPDPETGEEKLQLVQDDISVLIEIHALVGSNGALVVAATHYLYYKKKLTRDTAPIAKALLQYYRFLDVAGLRFDVFPDDTDDRPTYQFAQYLSSTFPSPKQGNIDFCDNRGFFAYRL